MSYPFTVVHEDNHLLVVNKPAGLLVQGDKTNDKPLLDYCKEYIKEKYQKPGEVFLGLAHRIDRPVSGLVVFARTSKCLERINKLFQSRDVQKTYWAVVKQKPSLERGRLVHWLVKNEAKNITTAYAKETKEGKKSELDFQVIGHLPSGYLLEIRPLTGRPHQIRVQLASMGCPIQGDLKYGYPSPHTDGNISLLAKAISFIHPVKKEPLSLSVPVPPIDYWKPFEAFDKNHLTLYNG